MLKSKYLSFNSKKYLTNGTDGCNPCAMNANGMILVLLALGSFFVFRRFSRAGSGPSQKCQARLKRIRNASFLFRLFIGISALFAVYWLLAFLFGWPLFFLAHVKMTVAHGHVYGSPAEMPPALLAWSLVKVGLDLAGAAVLYALFSLYGRGILFSARNVLYLRFQGYYLILVYIIDYQIKGILRDVDLSLGPVLAGLMIIFIAWIMDEGRKIQEEQELTV